MCGPAGRSELVGVSTEGPGEMEQMFRVGDRPEATVSQYTGGRLEAGKATVGRGRGGGGENSSCGEGRKRL